LNNKVHLPISYGRQEITEADERAVIGALRSDFLTQGPTVLEFEKAFASYIGAKYAVAVTNGTAALHLSCMALGVQAGKTVLTTPITFAASANSVLYCGGHVEFVDIDPRTYCIDVEQLEKTIAQNPSKYCGIIPVDYAGHPSDLPKIRDIAQRHGLWVLEDSCHAPGAQYSHLGKVFGCGSGEHSDLAIFSFHPVKHIATGEGGMVTTNDPVLYEKLKTLRTHGIVRDEDRLVHASHGGWYHEMQILGYNYRISDINCALGLSQLTRADAGIKRRRVIADYYNKHLSSSLVTPYVAPGTSHAYHLYVVQTPRRKELYDFLREHKIFCQVHYLPVYRHPYWEKLGNWRPCPEAEKFYDHCLSLPVYPSMTDAQLEYVVEKVNEFCRGK